MARGDSSRTATTGYRDSGGGDRLLTTPRKIKNYALPKTLTADNNFMFSLEKIPLMYEDVIHTYKKAMKDSEDFQRKISSMPLADRKNADTQIALMMKYSTILSQLSECHDLLNKYIPDILEKHYPHITTSVHRIMLSIKDTSEIKKQYPNKRFDIYNLYDDHTRGTLLDLIQLIEQQMQSLKNQMHYPPALVLLPKQDIPPWSNQKRDLSWYRDVYKKVVQPEIINPNSWAHKYTYAVKVQPESVHDYDLVGITDNIGSLSKQVSVLEKKLLSQKPVDELKTQLLPHMEKINANICNLENTIKVISATLKIWTNTQNDLATGMLQKHTNYYTLCLLNNIMLIKLYTLQFDGYLQIVYNELQKLSAKSDPAQKKEIDTLCNSCQNIANSRKACHSILHRMIADLKIQSHSIPSFDVNPFLDFTQHSHPIPERNVLQNNTNTTFLKNNKDGISKLYSNMLFLTSTVIRTTNIATSTSDNKHETPNQSAYYVMHHSQQETSEEHLENIYGLILPHYHAIQEIMKNQGSHSENMDLVANLKLISVIMNFALSLLNTYTLGGSDELISPYPPNDTRYDTAKEELSALTKRIAHIAKGIMKTWNEAHSKIQKLIRELEQKSASELANNDFITKQYSTLQSIIQDITKQVPQTHLQKPSNGQEILSYHSNSTLLLSVSSCIDIDFSNLFIHSPEQSMYFTDIAIQTPLCTNIPIHCLPALEARISILLRETSGNMAQLQPLQLPGSQKKELSPKQMWDNIEELKIFTNKSAKNIYENIQSHLHKEKYAFSQNIKTLCCNFSTIVPCLTAPDGMEKKDCLEQVKKQYADIMEHFQLLIKSCNDNIKTLHMMCDEKQNPHSKTPALCRMESKLISYLKKNDSKLSSEQRHSIQQVLQLCSQQKQAWKDTIMTLKAQVKMITSCYQLSYNLINNHHILNETATLTILHTSQRLMETADMIDYNCSHTPTHHEPDRRDTTFQINPSGDAATPTMKNTSQAHGADAGGWNIGDDR